jgi:urease accessory protein
MMGVADERFGVAFEPLALLAVLQLTDSFFPSGLYTLSHGIESYDQANLITLQSAFQIVNDLLRFAVGPSDGIALAIAHRSARTNLDEVIAADNRLTAVKLAREPRETSIRTGRQLLGLTTDLFGGDVLPHYREAVQSGAAQGNHAIVLGLAMLTHGVSQQAAVTAELYAFATGCLGAMLRMSLFDHRAIQSTLHHLMPTIVEVAQDACTREVWEIGGCAPLAEIMSMRHEIAEIRLFAS